MFLSNPKKFKELYKAFSTKSKSFTTGKNIAIASKGDAKKIKNKLLDTKKNKQKRKANAP